MTYLDSHRKQSLKEGIQTINRYNPYDYTANTTHLSTFQNEEQANTLLRAFQLKNFEGITNSKNRKLFQEAFQNVLDRNVILQRKIEHRLSLLVQFEDLRTRRVTGGVIPSKSLIERTKDWDYLCLPGIQEKVFDSSLMDLTIEWFFGQFKRDMDNFYDENLNAVCQLDQFIDQYQQK